MRKTPGRANAWSYLRGRYPLAEWEEQLLLGELPSQRK